MNEQTDMFKDYLNSVKNLETIKDPKDRAKRQFIISKQRKGGQTNTALWIPLSKCHECTLFDKSSFNPHNYFVRYTKKDQPGNDMVTKNPVVSSMDVMFVGQAIDYTEMNRGEIFVGESGRLFRDILRSINFNFNYVFYNTCQCHPKKDREPTKTEIECCFNNLEKVIKFFNPKIIVSLGVIPSKRLGMNGSLQTNHGKEFTYKSYKLVPTYHPGIGLPSRGQVHYQEYIKSDLEEVRRLLLGTKPITTIELGKGYKLITTIAEFDAVFNELEKAVEFAFDIETTGLDVFNYQILGIGFSCKRGEGAYLPLLINGMEVAKRFKEYKIEVVPDRMYPFWLPAFMDYIMKKVKTLLQNKADKYGHKIKFDIKGIKKHWGYWVKDIGFDTKTLYYLIDENYANDLNHIVNLHYPDIRGYKKISEKRLGFEKNFGLLPLNIIAQRCVIDCDATLRIAQDFYPKIRGKKLDKLLTNFYNPLVFIYVDAELNGIKIDMDYVEKKIPELEKEIKELEYDITTELGKTPQTLNLNSGDKLAEILYDEHHYPILKMTTKKTRGSVDKETLRQLFHDHGCTVAKKIRKYKILTDTLNRVFRGYTKNLDDNGRAHYEFHFYGRGNRLAASKINIHNPTKIDWIRRMFVAEEGRSFICADYSQLELRVVAWLSQDRNLLKAFAKNIDIHSETASAVFDIPMEKVEKNGKERDRSKMLNFAVGTYGATAKTGRDQINADLPYDADPISLEIVEKFKSYWDNKYYGACSYLNKNVQIGKTKGKLVTIFGHERRFDFKSFDALKPKTQADYINQMRNYVIQSTASTICQLALIQLWIWLKKNKLKTKFIMTLHDMIMVESPDNEIEVVKKKMEEIMINAVPSLSIQLKVDIDISKFWK